MAKIRRMSWKKMYYLSGACDTMMPSSYFKKNYQKKVQAHQIIKNWKKEVE